MNNETKNNVFVSNLPVLLGGITLGGVVVFTSTSKIHESFKLKREKRLADIDSVEFPPELEHLYEEVSYENLSGLSKRKFGDELLHFSKVITDNFDESDLINFYNNIVNLDTYETDFKKRNKKYKNSILEVRGSYVVNNNSIFLNPDDFKSTIYHELFHMSSSKVDENVVYSGFSQSKLGVKVGDALNEGYTQLLTERYFSEDEIIKSYVYFVRIALLTEKIIGKEKMEKLYLHSDLYGLIDELKKYAYYQDIMEFLSNLDFVFYHLDDKRVSSIKKKMIEKSLKQISEFLLLTYSIKLNDMYSSDYLANSENAMNDINEYLSLLPARVNVGDKSFIYGVLDDKLLEKISDNLYEFGIVSRNSKTL